MKKNVTCLLALLAALACARADQFQLCQTNNGATAHLAYAGVKISVNRRALFTGKTDKFGRITIPNLDKGQYEALVIHGTNRSRVKLTIDGGTNLKKVFVE